MQVLNCKFFDMHTKFKPKRPLLTGTEVCTRKLLPTSKMSKFWFYKRACKLFYWGLLNI